MSLIILLWLFCMGCKILFFFPKEFEFQIQTNWSLAVPQLVMHIHNWSDQIFNIWYLNNESRIVFLPYSDHYLNICTLSKFILIYFICFIHLVQMTGSTDKIKQMVAFHEIAEFPLVQSWVELHSSKSTEVNGLPRQ